MNQLNLGQAFTRVQESITSNLSRTGEAISALAKNALQRLQQMRLGLASTLTRTTPRASSSAPAPLSKTATTATMNTTASTPPTPAGSSKLEQAKATQIMATIYKALQPTEAKAKEPPVAEIVAATKQTVEAKHPFKGYKVAFEAASKAHMQEPPFSAMQCDKMAGTTPGIGNVKTRYTWTQPPSIHAPVPSYIQNPAVRLPAGLTAKEYDAMCQLAQKGTATNQGISPQQADALAFKLGGITIEATLPYKAGALLKDDGADVQVHYIFQSGLNFNGIKGGGIPVTNPSETKKEAVQEYTLKNAHAALKAASSNGSDVLVFNIGIGVGFFAGEHGDLVKQSNIDSIAEAATQAKNAGSKLQVVVPNTGYTSQQIKQLEDAGIQIIKGDKGAVAALCARSGLKVSETIAADPMSMLGIHGTGLWWETEGSASDEERAAFLSPSYGVSHVPIDVHEDGKAPQKIAAISQYMVASDAAPALTPAATAAPAETEINPVRFERVQTPATPQPLSATEMASLCKLPKMAKQQLMSDGSVAYSFAKKADAEAFNSLLESFGILGSSGRPKYIAQFIGQDYGVILTPTNIAVLNHKVVASNARQQQANELAEALEEQIPHMLTGQARETPYRMQNLAKALREFSKGGDLSAEFTPVPGRLGTAPPSQTILDVFIQEQKNQEVQGYLDMPQNKSSPDQARALKDLVAFVKDPTNSGALAEMQNIRRVPT